MSRYFSVYAAILAVLALLLFLSPQIAKFISADTAIVGAEILKNTDFKNEKTLDDRVWSFNLRNPSNSVKIVDNALQVDNTLSKDNFSLVAQRLTLSTSKTYELTIDFDWQNNKSIDNIASFGIMKRGLNNEVALAFPLPNTTTQSEIKKYFKINDFFEDPYLYVLEGGTGSLRVDSLSLREYDSPPKNIVLENTSASQILPISISAPITQNAETQATPTALASVVASPAPSPSPIQASSSSRTNSTVRSAVVADTIVAYPGWNVAYSAHDVSSEIFTKMGLTVFQMFGGSWQKTKLDSQAIILSKLGGIYIYNPTDETKNIPLVESKTPSEFSTKPKWNLLVNGTDNEIKNGSDFSLNGTTAKLADLIKDKKVSSEIYILNSNKDGVEMKKIDPLVESIPAKTAFWLYIN